MNQFLTIEIGILALYISCIFYIIKKDKKMILFFLASTLYAIFFENMNILLSQGFEGGYYYNKNFSIFIFHLPLFVSLAWSIIIYTSIKIAQSLKISENSLPFAASLIVLLIDLAIDVIAIRLEYWTWIGYSLKDGYFGVPASNFIGWLFISFSWFYIDQKLKIKKNWLKYSIMPIIAYIFYFLLFIPITLVQNIFYFNKTQQFFVLIFLIFLFLSLIKKGEVKHKTDNIIYIFRLPFYIFGFYFLLSRKIYQENILLLLFSIIFLTLEIALFLGEKGVFERKNNKNNIKIFKTNRISKK
ncbi:MAG: carotenoid biosynthesis protein [Candidatus Aenigmarchaeota archaeon]|nr:carotenoid biosynthesis protein [Candidatus Aenigmarchaeota archaeon]MBU5688890.1 carotenoid biosynthesis protein [Candidatus Aenigmarchaeota archaeon]